MWLVNLRMATLFHQVIMISCSKESVYGKRDGAVHGLVITHRDDRNVIRNTQGWKTGVVLGIRMLPRHEMWKPEAVPRNVMNITKYSFLLCDVYHPTLVLRICSCDSIQGVSGQRAPSPWTGHDHGAGTQASTWDWTRSWILPKRTPKESPMHKTFEKTT